MMKRIPVILLFIAILAMPSSAETLLTGGVAYTTESARAELKKHEAVQPDGLTLLTHIADENYKDNKTALLKGNVELKDRVLALFSDGSYAVMYHDNPLYVWYYSDSGILTHIEIKDRTNYPYKSFKYDTEGTLVTMGLRVSKEETFIFNPDGKLIAHWIRENGYDENGKVIMKRKYKG